MPPSSLSRVARSPRLLAACLAAALPAVAGVDAVLADSTTVFNEIMFHPAEPAGGEWIELRNLMAVDMDLSGWRISGGVDFEFPEGTVIESGGFVVVAGDPAPAGAALGPWTGNLSNGGETLRLRNRANRVMDEIDYADGGDWPVGPDGSGASLAKRDPETASDEAGNWTASLEVGGTPGAENFPEAGGQLETLALVPMDATWRYLATGEDPGPGWAREAHAVDGVAWREGQALLGFETTPDALPEALRTPFAAPAGGAVTYWFETDFVVDAATIGRIESLRLRHVIDDGAVVYLNGEEVVRFNLDAGPVDAGTVANSPVSNAALSDWIELVPGSLVAGVNRISVEVHQQSAGSSDMILGAELEATAVVPVEEPVTVRLSELSGSVAPAGTFRWELENTGSTLADLSGFVLGVRGMTDADHVLPLGTTVAGGAFLVLEEADLGFRPEDGDRVFLWTPDRSRLVDAVVADDRPRARSVEHGGRFLVPSGPTFGEANAFAIEDAVVINEIMYHFREDPGAGGGDDGLRETVLVPIGATWRFNESGADLGAGWSSASHAVDGSAWRTGPALIGSETTPEVLPEPLRTELEPSATNDVVTYYFETDFNLTATQREGLVGLRLRHVIDDGAVVHLNGTEVHRFNLPAGPVSASTTADSGVGNAEYEGPFEIPISGAVAGTNRLSVEVHQQSPASSDVVFGVELVAVTSDAEAVPPTPIVERDDEWIELFNRGGEPVDLTGWSLDGGIAFDFPPGTVIAAGGFLVIARDVADLAKTHPGIQGVVGSFRGSLGNGSDTIRLEDAVGNPADEVTYHDGGAWPSLADGDGSSLELRDPRADNAVGGAWAASDESGKSQWQTIRYRMDGGQRYGLNTWREFRLGMLRGGEVLVDDVSVVRDPDGGAQQMIRNGTFDGSPGDASWRFLGNHRHSEVVPEPGNPANRVLRVVATGATDTRHNHLETTFVDNRSLSPAETYEVSFRARWVSGSNQLNARAFYQRIARTTQLERPESCGSPGAPNSRWVANLGPTLHGLAHDPPVPRPGQPITVTVTADDPDGIDEVTLRVRADGAPATALPMTAVGDGRFSAVVPGRSAGAIVQFWVEASDGAGATSVLPAAGPDSRALCQVDDGRGTSLPLHQLRAIMLPGDVDFLLDRFNVMSNERLGGTVVYDGRTVVYDVGIRMRGSGAGRARDGALYQGFNIAFPADRLFRGVHESLSIDRSGRSPVGGRPDEIYVKHLFNRAGLPAMFDDLVYFMAPTSTHTGTAILMMAGYDGHFTETQFENGDRGTVFNLDITYDPSSTVDGNPESLKPPVPFQHIGTDFTDLGTDEEQYRAPFEIRTGRRRDDYSGLIEFCRTLALPTTEMEAQIETWMDVDQWMRYTALTVLCGIGDSFATGGLRHNIRLFVPDDGRGTVALPWDMDFVFNAGATSSMLPTTGNLRRVIDRPRFRRLYWGHVRDLVATTFNREYMGPWLERYGTVVGANFAPQGGYIAQRASHALSEVSRSMPVVPFSVTTGEGGDFEVDDTVAVVEGRGWIDIREFRLAGSAQPVATEWLDDDTWRVRIPVVPGANDVTLEAIGFQGELVAAHEVTITSTVSAPTPFEFLRITEIHYHPADPTGDERIAGTDDGDFEFVELRNIGDGELDLGGARFTAGIGFVFPDGWRLAPGAYAVVVRNRAAFEARYGTGLPVAGTFAPAGLDNSGERLRLEDRSGNAILDFTYDDAWLPATDGPGHSMVIADAGGGRDQWNDAAAWRISGAVHGSPGAPETAVATQFEAWRNQFFNPEERDDPDVSGPMVDLAGDGVPNLLRYSVGAPPRGPVPAELAPVLAWTGDGFAFQVRRPVGAVDLDLVPQASADLASWQPMTTTAGPPVDQGDGYESLTFVWTSEPAVPRAFARLAVTLRAP